MLTWNFINSQQTFMYISIFFVVFIILGVKKKISNSTITKQACPWTHNLRHHHPTWFPLSSSPAPRTSPAVPAEHGLLPLPPPQHQPPTQAAILEAHSSPCLSPSYVHCKGHRVLRQGPFKLSFWQGSCTCDMCSFVHSCPLSHPYSIHIPHKIHKHILFPACIVIDDKNAGPYVRVFAVFSWKGGILNHLALSL